MDVWQAVLDGTWQCRVRRTGLTTGELTVGRAGTEPVLRKEVTLAYGAMFGPDVDDVLQWEDCATAAVRVQP